MTNTSTLALVSVSPLDFTAASLFLPISLAVPFSLPLAVDPAHYRLPSCLLHPGLSQRGPRSFMRRPKGQIPSLITRKWAGMRTLPTLLQADSSFACFFFFLSLMHAHTLARAVSQRLGVNTGPLVWVRFSGEVEDKGGCCKTNNGRKREGY